MNSSYIRNLNSIPAAPMAFCYEAARPTGAKWGLVGTGDALFILNQVRTHKDSRLGYRKRPHRIK